MSVSIKNLETFINDYNNLFIINRDGELKFKNFDDFKIFLDKYGLINTSKDNYKKINFFKDNVNNLLSLPKNDKNSIWLLDNICKIIAIFSQIQTDHIVPDEGHYMYKNNEFKVGISASAYLMFFLQKIENSQTEKMCKFGEECKRCNPIHFEQFYHPRTNSSKTLKTTTHTSRNSRKYNPFKNGGKKTRKITKNTLKKNLKNVTNNLIYNVRKSKLTKKYKLNRKNKNKKKSKTRN